MRPLLAFVLIACCAAADPPPVPDPIGLGERLALIDHLREAYGVRPPAGATVEALRRLYADAWAARQRPVETLPEEDPSATAERVRRLRAHLVSRHGIEIDPALGERELQELSRRLDAKRAERDAADVAAMAEADRPDGRYLPVEPSTEPAAETAATPVETVAASTPPPAVAGAQARRIAFRATGVSDCILVTEGDRNALLVLFGADHNGAFADIPQATWAYLRSAPAIRRGVLLLGHGTGTTIAGESIENHLRANRVFYETLGGTAPAQRIECLVFASCSASNPDQMRAMRDGLGYYPTWRVATAPRAYATRNSVLAALRDVVAHPERPAWRGLYRMGLTGDEVGAFGEVGIDGERAETSYWRILDDPQSGFKVVEQR